MRKTNRGIAIPAAFALCIFFANIVEPKSTTQTSPTAPPTRYEEYVHTASLEPVDDVAVFSEVLPQLLGLQTMPTANVQLLHLVSDPPVKPDYIVNIAFLDPSGKPASASLIVNQVDGKYIAVDIVGMDSEEPLAIVGFTRRCVNGYIELRAARKNTAGGNDQQALLWDGGRYRGQGGSFNYGEPTLSAARQIEHLLHTLSVAQSTIGSPAVSPNGIPPEPSDGSRSFSDIPASEQPHYLIYFADKNNQVRTELWRVGGKTVALSAKGGVVVYHRGRFWYWKESRTVSGRTETQTISFHAAGHPVLEPIKVASAESETDEFSWHSESAYLVGIIGPYLFFEFYGESDGGNHPNHAHWSLVWNAKTTSEEPGSSFYHEPVFRDVIAAAAQRFKAASDEIGVVAVYPVYSSEGDLHVVCCLVHDVAYADSDHKWSTYTVSAVLRLSQLPDKIRTWAHPPRSLSAAISQAGGTFLGWYEIEPVRPQSQLLVDLFTAVPNERVVVDLKKD
jgi:hypothetical protein